MDAIASEQDALRVLHLLIAFAPHDDAGPLSWTTKNIGQAVDMSLTRSTAAVRRLERLGYISDYWPTIDGRRYYDEARSKPSLAGNLHAWKTEVLTGMDPRGAPTLIDNAVLPGSESVPRHMQTPEQLLMRADLDRRAKSRQASDLGIELEEFERRLLDGSAHICKGGVDGPHVGIFDKHGKGWQYMCRRCTKTARIKARVKK